MKNFVSIYNTLKDTNWNKIKEFVIEKNFNRNSTLHLPLAEKIFRDI